MTEMFHIGDLLSVTTGVLVSPTSMEGVSRLLDWMTGDKLMTHQLPLAADVMSPELVIQHPWLKGVQPPEGRPLAESGPYVWLFALANEHGDFHAVEPAPLAWGRHDPIQDFHNERLAAAEEGGV